MIILWLIDVKASVSRILQAFPSSSKMVATI